MFGRPSQPENDRPSRKRWLGIPGLRGAILGASDPAPPDPQALDD